MNSQPFQERELHLRDYLRVIYRRKWPALAVFVITAAVAIVRAYLAPPVYRATTRILIEKAEVQNIGMASPLYASWDPDFHRTQVQIIRSAATAERAAKALVADAGFRERFQAPAAVPSVASLTRMIASGIAADPEKESKIVTISYLSGEPALAAIIVNAVVKAYVDQLFEMKMSYSRYTIEWMTDKAREEQAQLARAERNLQGFVKNNDILGMENRVGGGGDRLSELGLELTKAEIRHRELETVYNRLAAVAGDPAAAETISAVDSDGAFVAVKTQLLKAEQSLSELSRRYGPKHPAIVAARQDVATLERKKVSELQRIVAATKNEMELVGARAEDLRRRLSSGRSDAVAANEKYIRYEELKRGVEANRQFYDTLMARAKQESLTQQLQGVQVWTLESAQVPASPDGPRGSRTILLGLMLGFAGAIAMAFFVDYLDNTVRSAEDLELKTGVPVLGVIPSMKTRGKEIELTMLHEPRLPASESYRALRTSIILSSEEGPPKILLVTSTVPEEGKTATAVNLALGIAQSGYSVVLVDADMRKPRVNKIFNLKNDYGLSTVLQTDERPAPLEVGVPNLVVLTSGPVPPNPSELLGSKHMDSLLKELRGSYDVTIVDSPPFLTVADGLVLARKVDAILLVTRSERSTYDAVKRGIKALADINVRPLGVVVNDYDDRRGGAYYYHQYYYEADAVKGKKNRKRRTTKDST